MGWSWRGDCRSLEAGCRRLRRVRLTAPTRLARGDHKRAEYQKVILPLVLLRRLDCVLEPTKAQVIARAKALTVQNVDPILKGITGVEAYNTSPLTLRRILADPPQVVRPVGPVHPGLLIPLAGRRLR